MTAEYSASLDHLRGKFLVEVVSVLPTFEWKIEGLSGQITNPNITGLTIVRYNTQKPRTQCDLYNFIAVNSHNPIPVEHLDAYLSSDPQTTTGLASLVHLGREDFQKGYYPILEAPKVHLPLIDIDHASSDLPEEEVLGRIKSEIKTKTELSSGVILSSGGTRGHYHFLGIGRLLTPSQFVTFLGLCLLMTDNQGQPMVDPRWVGHSLTPLDHLTEGLEVSAGWSKYKLVERFATLRLTRSALKENKPVVVDIL